MTTVKFCGLTRPEDAALAEELGAAYAGVVLARSARQVSPRVAREIFAGAPGLRHVGVFRRRDVRMILDDAAAAGLHVIQLHGDFLAAEIAMLRDGFDGDLWAVVPIDSQLPVVPQVNPDMLGAIDAVLLDTSVGGTSGGTGVAFDWRAMQTFARGIEGRADLIVAGGLNPANVGAMIRALAPATADVSSGVESSPGIKDRNLMAAFAEAVASASIV
jgi:phosphoribosylanthranilate isomerase